MAHNSWLRLAGLLVSAILAIVILEAWQADRRDRAQLATQLAAAQKAISQASASQHDRDSRLNQTLALIAAQKKTITTPAQILKALPKVIALPAPITSRSQLQPTAEGQTVAPTADINAPTNNSVHSTRLPGNPTPKPNEASGAILPVADLKPLYDFALDCQACQARLAAAQRDLADEKTKSAALTEQRDVAVRAAKGGSALRQIARAAKWFVLGAAAGALAAKAAH